MDGVSRPSLRCPVIDVVDSPTPRRLVTAQIGRQPREPWRVSSRCRYGFPNTIASPSRLDDGTPFPALVWLTCPWLLQRVGDMESAGGASSWTEKIAQDSSLAEALDAADQALRSARASESADEDVCANVGIAGQKDHTKVKCLHAHLGLALFGIADPIGTAIISEIGDVCPDRRCAELESAVKEPGHE